MPIKHNSQKTFAFKERMRIGREIADQLDPVMSIEEVAQRTGLSKVYVRRVECLALAKIAVRLRAAMSAGEFETPAPFTTRKRLLFKDDQLPRTV